MNPTPIEEQIRKRQDRDARKVHNAAFDAARARGADFHCASMVGFAATDSPPSTPKLCEVCVRRGVAEAAMESDAALATHELADIVDTGECVYRITIQAEWCKP